MRDDPNGAEQTETSKESVGDIFRTVVYALLIALAFRTILFQPFSIPSGSMKSTLLIGDYLFVSKYSYGYSRFSLPYGDLLPSFGGRLFGGEPERGDVIVFKQPGNTSTDYIKRLVGLPGDRLQVIRGVLHLNGEPVKLRRISDFREPVQGLNVGGTQLCSERTADRQTCVKYRSIETLPNGASYSVLDADGVLGGSDNTRTFIVPEGHYFFMGDNRDNSLDSRRSPFEGGIGFVPAENLVGRAEMVLFSARGSFFSFWTWRGDRFFKWIE